MSFTRPTSMLRSAALRPATLRPMGLSSTRLQVRFATQDYGSGKGNPAGEQPKKQGQNPSEHMEHPGPPPPKVAQGKSSSSPNSSDKTPSSSSSSSSKSSSDKSQSPSQKRSFSTSTRRASDKEPAVKSAQQNKPKPSDIKNAQPKILNETPPAESEESEDVKEHNREMEGRAEQAHEKVGNGEEVEGEYWKGMCF
jgi:hypothetical protein